MYVIVNCEGRLKSARPILKKVQKNFFLRDLRLAPCTLWTSEAFQSLHTDFSQGLQSTDVLRPQSIHSIKKTGHRGHGLNRALFK